jgi:hypothetical protein
MFGMRSQAAPTVRVVQDHSESLIGCADSAGITAYPAPALTVMLADLRREQGRHKTYDHWLLIQQPRDADSRCVAKPSMTEKCGSSPSTYEVARQIC